MNLNLRKRFTGQYIAVMIFIGALCVGMIGGFRFEYLKYREYKTEISKINSQIKETDAEIVRLKSQSGTSNLEKMARQKLGMVKSGEIVYIDIDQNQNQNR
ncbi:MAG: septum formation initiator family protein [Clostridioides sp.]|nr:septum formation initiator family protein [Clostridioides sp.]